MAADAQPAKYKRRHDDEEKEKPIIAKTATDLQRLRLEKLMKHPDKPVPIPERPKEKNTPHVPDFVRNVMGSSAGAGSGEFHVYRHLRRKEYARQKFIQEKAEKEMHDEEYHKKLEENRIAAEQRTAKKRAKRLKKKQKLKGKKKLKTSANAEKDASSESEESENEEETNGRQDSEKQTEEESRDEDQDSHTSENQNIVMTDVKYNKRSDVDIKDLDKERDSDGSDKNSVKGSEESDKLGRD